jgi:hypothetical protein
MTSQPAKIINISPYLKTPPKSQDIISYHTDIDINLMKNFDYFANVLHPEHGMRPILIIVKDGISWRSLIKLHWSLFLKHWRGE